MTAAKVGIKGYVSSATGHSSHEWRAHKKWLAIIIVMPLFLYMFIAAGQGPAGLQLFLNNTEGNYYYSNNSYANISVNTAPFGLVNISSDISGWANTSEVSPYSVLYQIICPVNNTWYIFTAVADGDNATHYAICNGEISTTTTTISLTTTTTINATTSTTSTTVSTTTTTTIPPDWTIDGSTIYINDSRVYASANPHTVYGSGWVYFNLTSKVYTGDIDLVWGFDTSEARPTHAEFYHPHNVSWDENYSQIFYNVSKNTSASASCQVGFSYNTYKRNVTYTERLFNDTDNKTYWIPTSKILCFDSYASLGNNNIQMVWHEEKSRTEDWLDETGKFSSLDYDHGGMNKWYYVTNIPIIANTSYMARGYVDVPVKLGSVGSKYWFCFKRSIDTIQEAIAGDRLYCLDPWWNSSWGYSKPVTITSYQSLTDYQVRINVSYNSYMQSNFNDIRFVAANGSTLSYWLESKVDGSWAIAWVKVTALSVGSNTIYMYYGNPLASSASSGDNTFLLFDDFDDGVFDTNKWETYCLGNLPGCSWSSFTESNGFLNISASGDNGGAGIHSKNNEVNNNSRIIIQFVMRSVAHGTASHASYYGWCRNSHGEQSYPNPTENYQCYQMHYWDASTYHGSTGGWASLGGTATGGQWWLMNITLGQGSMNMSSNASVTDTNRAYYATIPSVHNVSLDNTVAWGLPDWKEVHVDYVRAWKEATVPPIYSFGSEHAQNWWGTDWKLRKAITVTSTQTLTDYQANFNVTYDSDMQADFDDLRFSQNNLDELSYWIESKSDSQWASVWVKVPALFIGSNTIYLYYGNPSVSSASNGNTTFILFDDFNNGTTLDTSKWTANENYGVRNGLLWINDSGTGGTRSAVYSANIANMNNSYTKFMFFQAGDAYKNDNYPITITNKPADYTTATVQLIDQNPPNGLWADYSISNSWEFAPKVGPWMTLDAWHPVAVWQNGTHSGWVNESGTYITYNKATAFDSGVMLGFFATSFNAGTNYTYNDAYDYIFTRKYSTPEPTYSVGSEQTQNWYDTSYECRKEIKSSATIVIPIFVNVSTFWTMNASSGEKIYIYYKNRDCTGDSVVANNTNQKNHENESTRIGYTPTLVWSDYAAVYHFGECSGTNVYDSLGLSNGTATGATYNTSAIFGCGMFFDGVNDVLNISNTAALRDIGKGSYTYEAWLYPTAISSLYFEKRDGTSLPYPFALASAGATSKPQANINNVVCNANYALPLNQWSYVVVVRDKSIGNVTIYINGTKDVSCADAQGDVSNDDNLEMGYINWAGYYKFSIDEFRISNTTKSEDYILNQYQRGIATLGMNEIQWLDSSYAYRRQIISNSTSPYPLSVNDTGGIKGSIIWAFVDNASYVYSKFYQSGDGIKIGGKLVENYWENAYNGLGNNPTSVWNFSCGNCSTSGYSNPVGLWHMDEGTGTNVRDSLGVLNGTFAASTNDPSWNTTSCKFGNCTYYDGNDRTKILDNAKFTGMSNMSIFCWVNYPTSQAGYNFIMSKREEAGATHQMSWTLGVNAQTLTGWTSSNGVTGNICGTPAGSLNLGSWLLVGWTWSVSGNMVMYINGTAVTTCTDQATAPIFDSTADVYFGAEFTSGTTYDGYFIGTIDECSIYASVLPNETIQAMWWNGINNQTRLGIDEYYNWVNASDNYRWQIKTVNVTNTPLSVNDTFGVLNGTIIWALVSDGSHLYSGNPTMLSSWFIANTFTGLYNPFEVETTMIGYNQTSVWSNYKLVAHMSNNVFDSSPYGNNGTNAGNPTYNSTGVFGSSWLGDGTGDYINFGNSASLDCNGSFTMTVWAKPHAWGGGNDYIADKLTPTTANAWQIRLLDDSGNLKASIKGDGSANSPFVTTTGLTNNQWAFISFVRDTVLGKIILYVNGVQVGNATDNTVGSITNAGNFYVGTDWTSSVSWDGEIDEARWGCQALSATEIQQQYQNGLSTSAAPLGPMESYSETLSPTLHLALNGTESSRSYTYGQLSNATAWNNEGLPGYLMRNGTNVTSLTYENTVLPAGLWNYTYYVTGNLSYTSGSVTYYATVTKAIPTLAMSNGTNAVSTSDIVANWRFEQDLLDTSGNGYTLANNGATQTILGRFGKGYSFNGASNYLQISDNDNLDGFTTMSLCAWVYPNTSSTASRAIADKYFSGAGAYKLSVGASSEITFSVNTSSVVHARDYGTPLQSDSWSFICGVYNGTHVMVYLNGSLLTASVAAQTGTIINGNQNLRIGAALDNTYWWNGTLDEIIIFRRALSSAEVQLLYGTANTYPIQTNFSFASSADGYMTRSDISKTLNDYKAYWSFDGIIKDSSYNGFNNLTNYGASQTTGKFNGAYLFSGSNYMRIEDSSSLSLGGSTQLTITAWVKHNLDGSRHVIVSKFAGSGTDGYSMAIESSGKPRFSIGNGSAVEVTANNVINYNQWYLITGVFNSTHLLIYINDTLDNTLPIGGSIAVGTNSFTIGSWATVVPVSYFNGTIDDVRVYNRSLSSSEISSLYNARNSSQYYRKAITITSASLLTDYQVALNITYSGNMKPDFSDMMFMNSSGSYLSYWIEQKVDSQWAYVWVKVPTVNAGSTTIYLYYNNPSYYSSASSGPSTFLWFRDENNLNLWTNGTTMKVGSDGAGYMLVTDDTTADADYAYTTIDGLGSLDQFVWETRWYGVDKAGNDKLNMRMTDTPGSNNVVIWQYSPCSDCTSFGPYGLGYADPNDILMYNGNFSILYRWSVNITNSTFAHTIRLFSDNRTQIGITKEDSNAAQLNPTKTGIFDFKANNFNTETHVDFMYIRKYASSEPTYSFGAEEIGNPDSLVLPAGNYYYDAFSPENQNYTVAELIIPLNINKASPVVSLTITPSSPITYNDSSTNATCIGTALYRNGTDVTSAENAKNILLPAGVWNYTCSVLETQNYTSGSTAQMYTVNKYNANVAITILPYAYCYQEFANQTTSCGGLGTGTYITGGGWQASDPYSAYDGNWATQSSGGYDPGGYILINYTKPAGAASSSLWQVKDSEGTVNLSIPVECWNADSNVLMLKLNSSFASHHWDCFNSTLGVWISLRGAGSYPLYEEAIWWSMTPSVYTYPTWITQYCTDSSPWLDCLLYRNGALVANNTYELLPVGNYTYVANITDNQNYTNYQAFYNVTINKYQSAINLVITPSTPITYETQSNATCTDTNPEAIAMLYRNGTLVNIVDDDIESWAGGSLSSGNGGSFSNAYDENWNTYAVGWCVGGCGFSYEVYENFTKNSTIANITSKWAQGGTYVITSYWVNFTSYCYGNGQWNQIRNRYAIGSGPWTETTESVIPSICFSDDNIQIWTHVAGFTNAGSGNGGNYYESKITYFGMPSEIAYLPAGVWNYTCYVSDTENYTGASTIQMYTVNQKDANVQVYPVTQSQTYTYTATQYCTDDSAFLSCSIYRNETLISNSTQYIPAYGVHVYKANISDAANYTNYQDTETLTISQFNASVQVFPPPPSNNASSVVVVDSLSSKNVTFTDNQNQTVYLNIPKNVTVTSAQLNISGYYARSLLVQTADTSGGLSASVALDTNNYSHIAHGQSIEMASPNIRYCNNTLGTWTCANVISDAAQYVAIALDSSNNPRIAYSKSGTIDANYCAKSGSSWSCESIETGGAVGRAISLSVDPADKSHVVYRNSTGEDTVRYCSRATGSWVCENIPTPWLQGTPITITNTKIRVDKNTIPHVLFYGTAPTFWSTVYCNKTAGNWLCNNISSQLSEADLDIDSNGIVHVVGEYGAVTYYCNNTNGWNCIDTGLGSVTIPNIAIGKSNSVHISYGQYIAPNTWFYYANSTNYNSFTTRQLGLANTSFGIAQWPSKSLSIKLGRDSTSTTFEDYPVFAWDNDTLSGNSTVFAYYSYNYTTNPYLDVANDGDIQWSYSGIFNQLNNRTSDFSSEINDYLSTCTPVGLNCNVPLVLHSDTAGVIQISGVNVNYQTNVYYPSWIVQYCTDQSVLLDCLLYRNGVLIPNNTAEYLPPGNYTWLANISDTANYTNYQAQSTLNISKGFASVTLTITPSTPITYETQANATCTGAGVTNIILYKNGTNITSQNSQLLYLPVGVWNYTCVAPDNQNYTGTSTTQMYTVNQKNANVEVYPEPQTQNYPFTVFQYCEDTSDLLTCNIYRNETPITNGTYFTPPVGVYTYKGNLTDSFNYTNYEDIDVLNITQNQTVINIYWDPETPITYNDSTTNVSCDESNPEGHSPFKLWRNGTDITNTEMNNYVLLPAGVWNYTCWVNATQNYSSAVTTRYYTVNKYNANVQVYPVTQIVTYPTWLLQYCTSISPWLDCQIYRNGVLIGNNTNVLLPVGNYTYIANISDNQNYTNYQSSSMVNITINNTQMTLSVSPSSPIIYETLSNATCTETNPEASPVLYRNGVSVGIGGADYISEVAYIPYNAGWNYTCVVAQTQNYTGVSATVTYVVNKFNANVQVYPTTQSMDYEGSPLLQYCTDDSAFWACDNYRNGSLITNGTNPRLGASIYLYSANITDTFNYTNYQSSAQTLTVTKHALDAHLYLDGLLDQNVLYLNHATTNATAYGYNLDGLLPSLYRDGAYKGQTEIVMLTPGNYTYKANMTGNANYTSDSVGKSYNATVVWPPFLLMQSPVSGTYILGSGNKTIALNYTVSDLYPVKCWYHIDTYPSNITLASCLNTTFNVSAGHTYTVILYANESYAGQENSTSATFWLDFLNQWTVNDAIGHQLLNGTAFFNNGTYNYTLSTANGIFYENTSELPQGNMSVTFAFPNMVTYTANYTVDNSTQINDTISMGFAGLSIRVFGEDSLAAIPWWKLQMTNSTVAAAGAGGYTTQITTGRGLGPGASLLDFLDDSSATYVENSNYNYTYEFGYTRATFAIMYSITGAAGSTNNITIQAWNNTAGRWNSIYNLANAGNTATTSAYFYIDNSGVGSAYGDLFSSCLGNYYCPLFQLVMQQDASAKIRIYDIRLVAPYTYDINGFVTANFSSLTIVTGESRFVFTSPMLPSTNSYGLRTYFLNPVTTQVLSLDAYLNNLCYLQSFQIISASNMASGQAMPISEAKLTLYRNFGGNKIIMDQQKSDYSGIAKLCVEAGFPYDLITTATGYQDNNAYDEVFSNTGLYYIRMTSSAIESYVNMYSGKWTYYPPSGTYDFHNSTHIISCSIGLADLPQNSTPWYADFSVYRTIITDDYPPYILGNFTVTNSTNFTYPPLYDNQSMPYKLNMSGYMYLYHYENKTWYPNMTSINFSIDVGGDLGHYDNRCRLFYNMSTNNFWSGACFGRFPPFYPPCNTTETFNQIWDYNFVSTNATGAYAAGKGLQTYIEGNGIWVVAFFIDMLITAFVVRQFGARSSVIWLLVWAVFLTLFGGWGINTWSGVFALGILLYGVMTFWPFKG